MSPPPPEYDFAEQQDVLGPALVDSLEGRISVLAAIRGMIESLQQVSRQAVNAMDAGQKQARDTVAHADGTRQSLEEILRSVSTISGTSGSIASASVQQSHSVDQINKTIVSISEVAEQTNQGARELVGSSAELGVTATRLQELISNFKTA